MHGYVYVYLITLDLLEEKDDVKQVQWWTLKQWTIIQFCSSGI